MIRILRAFAWLRWRTMVNTVRKGRGRDDLERISRAAAVIGPILLLLLALPTAALLAGAAGFGGFYAGSKGAVPPQFLIPVRVVLGALTLAIVMAPLVRSIHGGLPGLDRLVLLPIPRGLLHLSELASAFADPWLVVALPALLALPVGLLSGGAPIAAGIVLAAGVAFALCLAALSACLMSVVSLVLRKRRRAETMALVVVALLTLTSFTPVILESLVGSRAEKTARPDPALYRWIGVLPSELYARSFGSAAEGREAEGLASLAAILATGFCFYGLSWLAYRRLLETPAGGGGKRGRGRRALRLVRLPGLSPAASAVAMAQVRLALRTLRGRTQIYFTPVTIAVLGIVFRHMSRTAGRGLSPFSNGLALAGFGTFLAILGLQPFQLNQFAGDRAGLTLQLLAPVSDRDLVRGKAAGIAILWALTQALCLAAAFLVAPGGSPLMWAMVILAGVSMLAGLTPVAAAVSALFPRASDPGRLGRAGNCHGASSLVGGLVSIGLGAVPLALATVGTKALDSPALALALTAVWALGIGLVALPLLGPVARLVGRRRENLGMVAQGR